MAAYVRGAPPARATLLGAARALWEARDAIAAAERDVTPGRILPDSAIVVAATAMPTDRRSLLATQGFHGRGASRYASTWVDALQRVREMPEAELPSRAPRGEGPPHPRTWADREPVADRRFKAARESMLNLAEVHHLPVENLLTPDFLRRLMWAPPATREPAALADAVRAQLASYGARPWQTGLVTGALVGAILGAEVDADYRRGPRELRGQGWGVTPTGTRWAIRRRLEGDSVSSGDRISLDASSISCVVWSRSRVREP